jgi:hypothetical protein
MRSVFFIFLLSLKLISLEGQEQEALPVDKDTQWVVGFSTLQGVNLSVDNDYLTHSIPLIFKEKLTSITTHCFKPEEILAYQKAIIKKELALKIQELLNLQQQRDKELFSSKKEYEKQKAITDYEKKIEETKTRITYLRNLGPESISFADKKPILFKDDQGKLFEAPKFSPLQYASEKELQVLIWGKIEEVQNYLYLEINIFDRILEKNIFNYKEAGSREDLYKYFQEAIKKITTVLIGRDWCSLLITAEPKNAYIKVNDLFMGLGSAELAYLEPGLVKIEVYSPGYLSQKEELEVKAYDSLVKEIKLTKSDHNEIFIQSFPPEANIYLDSLWIGKTPLIIERPAIMSRLLIKKEEFGDSFIRVGPTSPMEMEVSLIRIYIDKTEYQEKMANRFYNSLGAFLISVPLPLFCYGLSADYYRAGKEKEGRFYFYTYRWTVFLSGVLFANMIYDLFLYIHSGDRPQG